MGSIAWLAWLEVAFDRNKRADPRNCGAIMWFSGQGFAFPGPLPETSDLDIGLLKPEV